MRWKISQWLVDFGGAGSNEGLKPQHEVPR